jgi:hypothetical protein
MREFREVGEDGEEFWVLKEKGKCRDERNS